MENPIWRIIFYVALVALLVVLYIKKRKQVRDTEEIEQDNLNNKPKNDDEN